MAFDGAAFHIIFLFNNNILRFFRSSLPWCFQFQILDETFWDEKLKTFFPPQQTLLYNNNFIGIYHHFICIASNKKKTTTLGEGRILRKRKKQISMGYCFTRYCQYWIISMKWNCLADYCTRTNTTSFTSSIIPHCF